MLPSDVRERARARQVMSWLRTSLMALREARPTSSVFGRPVNVPLSDAGRSDADELVRVTDQLLGQGRQSLFTTWSVADADLALALMRLVANGDDVPQRIVQYVEAQWQRPSIRKYIAQMPTSH
jgi:glutathione S-transferase